MTHPQATRGPSGLALRCRAALHSEPMCRPSCLGAPAFPGYRSGERSPESCSQASDLKGHLPLSQPLPLPGYPPTTVLITAPPSLRILPSVTLLILCIFPTTCLWAAYPKLLKVSDTLWALSKQLLNYSVNSLLLVSVNYSEQKEAVHHQEIPSREANQKLRQQRVNGHTHEGRSTL